MTEHDRLLAAYRELHGPTAEERSRGWEGLAARARAGEIVALDDDEDPAPAVAPRRTAVVLFAAAAAVALLWVGAQLPSFLASDGDHANPSAASDERRTGAPSQARVVDDATPTPVPAEPPRVRDVAAPDVAPTEVMPEPPAIAPAVDTTTPLRSPRRAAIADEAPREAAEIETPTAATTVEPTIDADEIAALRRAQSLAASAPSQALDAIAAHARRYPSSSLAAEREITRMRALCNLGRSSEVREAVAAFERAHAGSPLLARVRGLCADGE